MYTLLLETLSGSISDCDRILDFKQIILIVFVTSILKIVPLYNINQRITKKIQILKMFITIPIILMLK